MDSSKPRPKSTLTSALQIASDIFIFMFGVSMVVVVAGKHAFSLYSTASHHAFTA